MFSDQDLWRKKRYKPKFVGKQNMYATIGKIQISSLSLSHTHTFFCQLISYPITQALCVDKINKTNRLISLVTINFFNLIVIFCFNCVIKQKQNPYKKNYCMINEKRFFFFILNNSFWKKCTDNLDFDG